MCIKKERGIILYLALVILGAVLAIVLGVGVLFVGQIKLIGGIGNAVIAFYAAEAGIERATFEKTPIGGTVSDTLSNSAQYNVSVLAPSAVPPLCEGSDRCIQSVGIFHNTSRAIDISLGN